jgi:hypothetical protein
LVKTIAFLRENTYTDARNPTKKEVSPMNQFLAREKMSKREKRALDANKRTIWDGINPITRKTENKKAYSRKKSPRWYKDDSTGIFVCITAS